MRLKTQLASLHKICNDPVSSLSMVATDSVAEFTVAILTRIKALTVKLLRACGSLRCVIEVLPPFRKKSADFGP